MGSEERAAASDAIVETELGQLEASNNDLALRLDRIETLLRDLSEAD